MELHAGLWNSQSPNWNSLLGFLTNASKQSKLLMVEHGEGEDGFALQMEYKKKKFAARQGLIMFEV